MVRANLGINGGDEDWFEALREEVVGVARKTGAGVAEAIVRWAYERQPCLTAAARAP